MMPLTVTIDTETGRASLQPSLPLPLEQDLKFSLQDTRSRLYLTPSGWSANRKTLFQARLTEGDTTLHLDQAVTALLASGIPLLLEEIYVNYREAFVWPRVAPEPAIGPIVEAEEPPEPEANQPAPAVEPVTTEIADTADEPPPVIAPSPTETQVETEDPPAIRWRVWSAAALILLLCVPLAMWMLREGETKMAEQAAPSEQAKAAPAVNPPPSPPRTDGDAQTAEIKLLKNEIAALKEAAVQRNSELNLANIELTDLRKRAAEFDEQLRLARLTPTPTYKPSAELMAQVEQQKDIIIRYQKLLSAASATRTSPDEKATLQILSERNTQLTKQVADQAEIIAALQGDVRELRLKRDLSASDTRKQNPQGKWLALARDAKGIVYLEAGYESALEASEAAMEACRSDSIGCRASGTRENTCYAIARPAMKLTNIYSWSGMGATQERAEADAKALCQQASGASICEISNAACAPASRGNN